MGSDANSAGKATALPSRPRFSWDIKQVSWTDGRGLQDGYKDAVGFQYKFHDLLDDSNFSKIPKCLCGTILPSQLYGRAKYQARVIDKRIFKSEKGAQEIVECIYKRVPLCVVTEVHADLSRWLTPARETKNY